MAGDRSGFRPVTDGESEEERDHKRKISRKPTGIDPLGSEEEAKQRKEAKRKRTRTDSSSASESESDSESEEERKRRGKRKSDRRSRRRKSKDDDDSDSESEYSSEYSDSDESESESGEDRKKRKSKDRKKRDKEEERRRRRKKEKRRMRREKEEEREKKRRKRKKEKKKEKLEKGKKGAVTNSWGKYGIIRETDMWNKRPEFTAWLAEVKKVNLESLPAWEEKQMFKDFMEDHNTATFPSKKYYNIDAYYKHKMEKEWKKGMKKVTQNERTVFNDEEQRRLELQQAREKQKEEEVQALKLSMQSGMAQAMRDQARLREEMNYLFKIGNTEAAAAIQRRLDPDVPM